MAIDDTAAAERSIWTMTVAELSQREHQLQNAAYELHWQLLAHVTGNPEAAALLEQLSTAHREIVSTARANGAAAASGRLR